MDQGSGCVFHRQAGAPAWGGETLRAEARAEIMKAPLEILLLSEGLSSPSGGSVLLRVERRCGLKPGLRS
ncbi:MAG: hypothetical protein KatS3mg058_0926 [Roseiflexus sp.]|nr:MAG: hypothetical protein KatS3mg058_0926 [Roseiflexus sp.]